MNQFAYSPTSDHLRFTAEYLHKAAQVVRPTWQRCACGAVQDFGLGILRAILSLSQGIQALDSFPGSQPRRVGKMDGSCPRPCSYAAIGSRSGAKRLRVKASNGSDGFPVRMSSAISFPVIGPSAKPCPLKPHALQNPFGLSTNPIIGILSVVLPEIPAQALTTVLSPSAGRSVLDRPA
jgi:hypothetical protein